MKYHDKKFPKATTFNHTEKQEEIMEKEAKKRGITKSELLRKLIDNA